MLAKELTAGERLFVQRRRDGISQAEAAKAYGLPLNTYRLLEQDDEKAAHEWRVPAPALGKLELHEKCTLVRRRAGQSLADAAKHLGVTSAHLCRMERGRVPATTLAERLGLAG